MRLTNVLLKESYRWRFRMLWQQKSRFLEHPVVMPSFIKQRGIEVVDGKDYIKPDTQSHLPKWEPPVKDDPLYMAQKTIKDLPDYHDEPIYEFQPSSCLIEGDKQACILTKTQPFYSLPPAITEMADIPEIPDQDLLVQRIIMQANVWDPTKVKLPKRVAPDLPIWKFKTEFGIPQDRLISNMIRNLTRLLETLHGRYPALDASRRIVTDPYLSTYYYFQGDKHISIRGSHNAMVYADRPLAAFGDENLVDASTRHELPDLFPLLPTIDLTKQHVWRAENVTGMKEGFSHCYPHTLFIGYNNTWTPAQRNATALMFCFGHTMALAKQKYGWESTELPAPIPLQCVLTNGVNFRFVCFQLNTLNYASADGVKNFAWFSSDDTPLYNKLVPKRSMLRNTKYEDYDPDVFRRLVAFYVNGAAMDGDVKSRRIVGESAAGTAV